MRPLHALVILALSAAPSGAQWTTTPPPAPLPRAPIPYQTAPFAWNPTADYIEPGQDEPGYRSWLLRQPWRAGFVQAFHRYLTAAEVAGVAPTWQLLRTASDWRRCGAEPFEVPPAEEWANIVNTLRYVRDYVVPAVGPVEPVSVFRNEVLNRCAGGAPESVHQSMSAIDFVPVRPIDRDSMIRRLCAEHQREGPRYTAGLGFYTKLRFHVDSWKYRTWGRNESGGIACAKVEIAPPPVLASSPVTSQGQAPVGGASQSDGMAAPPAISEPAPPPTAASTPVRDPLSPL